jgi:hypothetical protein
MIFQEVCDKYGIVGKRLGVAMKLLVLILPCTSGLREQENHTKIILSMRMAHF